jgi:hypothetical protein
MPLEYCRQVPNWQLRHGTVEVMSSDGSSALFTFYRQRSSGVAACRAIYNWPRRQKKDAPAEKGRAGRGRVAARRGGVWSAQRPGAACVEE